MGRSVVGLLSMPCPRAVVFDLDDTLAESFHPPVPETLEGLKRLLERIPVAIITGAGFARMESQFLSVLTASPHADRLYIFPGSSAQGYAYTDGAWKRLYSVGLTEEDRRRITRTILEVVESMPALKEVPHEGQQLFEREEQIAYTHVGIGASADVKKTWDPGGSMRKKLWSDLREKLPEFEILMGGQTTIDITPKGIDKSHGVTWLSTHLGIPPGEMLYVGDALYEGGNDAVVIPTGIETRAVEGPEDTQRIIGEILAACTA